MSYAHVLALQSTKVPAAHGEESAQATTGPSATGDMKLPPPCERLLTDCLSRKFLSSAGEKWIPRFCVLSKDRLVFAKLFNTDKASQWMLNTDIQSLSVERLRNTFHKHDIEKNGCYL